VGSCRDGRRSAPTIVAAICRDYTPQITRASGAKVSAPTAISNSLRTLINGSDQACSPSDRSRIHSSRSFANVLRLRPAFRIRFRRLRTCPPDWISAAMCQLETSCRVPGHGLHGRKCIAVAADSAAKIKNTEPGPLAITVTMTSPMPYPPDAASMARATPTMRNNAARNA
jgi:hypothetical protein